MKILNVTTAAEATYSQAYHTVNMGVEGLDSYAVQAVIDVDPAAYATAKTFDSGGAEATRMTLPAKAAITAGDYVTLTDANGASWAVYGDTTGAIAAPTGAIYTAIAAGKKGAALLSEPAAVTFDAGTSESGVITFQNKAGTTAGDYIRIVDGSGDSWAIAANVSGADPVPSGAIYTAIPAAQKGQADISADVSAADVAARFVTAFNALVGFNARVTLTDNLDGTVAYANVVRGNVTDAVVKNADDSGAGSIAVVPVNGTASEVDVAANTMTIPSHGLRTALKVRVSTSGPALPTGLAAATDYYVIVVDANTIKLATTRANSLVPTPINITDQGGSGGVFTVTTQALAAEDVAYEFYKKFNALTGFTAVVTLTDNADGTVDALNAGYATATDSQVKNADDSGAGSITTAVTDQGVATEISVTNNTVTIPTHGYSTGLKGRLTTTGTLPAGLALVTDYFIISVDTNTVAFASSLANAQAGTKVDITDYGSDEGVHTFTPTALAGASIKLQESNDGTNWDDVSGSSSNITADADIWVSQTSVRAQYLRTYLTMTAGHISASLVLHCKGAG